MMDSTILLAIFFLLVFSFLLLYWKRKERLSTQRAISFFQSRKPCELQSFIVECGLFCDTDDEIWFIAKVRRCIAVLGKIPEISVYATDTFSDTLAYLPFWSNIDIVIFDITLEKETGYLFEPSCLQNVTNPEFAKLGFSVADFVRQIVEAKKLTEEFNKREKESGSNLCHK